MQAITISKEGYRDESLTQGWTATDTLGQDGKRIYEVRSRDGKLVGYSPASNEKLAIEELSRLAGKGPIPNAPFKTTWPDLALKRMIRWAAEQGYDRIAWTPGEVQADRYDLSKHVTEITFRKTGDGTWDVGAHNGDTTVWSDGAASTKVIEDTLGKEIAEKIANGGERGSLTGIDLKFVAMNDSRDA